MEACKEKISVVIPTHNSAPYLKKCIDSILNQTYPCEEIVICDDASEDETPELLKAYESDPRFVILYSKENIFQGATRNLCFQKCTGDYIMTMDADDVSEPERAEHLLKALHENPDVDFVGSWGYRFDEGGIYGEHGNGPLRPTRKDLLHTNPFIPASIMFRAHVIHDIGGYRIAKFTRRSEDLDLIFRLYAAGYQGMNIPERLYGYLVDRNTYARRTFSSRLDECYIRYLGFKDNHMLWPVGWLYTLRPLIAYFYQQIKLLFRGTHAK